MVEPDDAFYVIMNWYANSSLLLQRLKTNSLATCTSYTSSSSHCNYALPRYEISSHPALSYLSLDREECPFLKVVCSVFTSMSMPHRMYCYTHVWICKVMKLPCHQLQVVLQTTDVLGAHDKGSYLFEFLYVFVITCNQTRSLPNICQMSLTY